MPSSFLVAAVRSASARFAIHNVQTGRVLATAAALAADSRSRRKGLLGRSGLNAGEALVIAPTSAIHTFFMRFPIDVLFVRRDGTVSKAYSRLVPRRIAFAAGAFAAIELPVGAIAASNTARGHAMRVVLD